MNKIHADRVLRCALLLSVLGIGGWNDGQVGVKVEHIAGWGAGTPSDPIVVSRDNPWFDGWYSAPPGRWMSAMGIYSHQYQNSPFAGGFLRTFEFADTSWNNVDDWQTPVRGDSLAGVNGYQTSDGGSLKWAMRSGNLVPGGLYAVSIGKEGPALSSTWYRLAESVLVVPVVVIAWRKPENPEAGSLAWQDYRTRATALFDFIPFQGSKTTNWPADWGSPYSWWPEPTMYPWTQYASADPTANYDPPDDIWSQCGIQFQVVASFVFDAPYPNPPNCYGNVHHFYSDPGGIWGPGRDSLIQDVIGFSKKNLIVDQLDPVFVEFGYLNCSFHGNAVLAAHTAEIDRADFPPYDGPPTNLVAHELGHVLLNASGHEDDAQNLMHANLNGHSLTPAQCSAAANNARSFASRFWQYNRAIGRISSQNPYVPTYTYGEDPAPFAASSSCCQNGNQKGWADKDVCIFGGGTIVPDQQCTVCCLVGYDPPDAEFAPFGECPQPQTIQQDWCDKVCCEIDTQHQFMSRIQCEYTQGGTIVDVTLCHR